MINVELNTKGIDDFIATLKERVEQPVQVSELLTDTFVAKHSKLGSFSELIEKSPFKISSAEDFKAIPDLDWDNYISSVTNFKTWADMLSQASSEYLAKKFQK